MAKTNSTTMVYESLKDKILRGVYSTSASLPEVELANEYNVSRNTIKKALLMLENDGYVTIEMNKGAKVRSYSSQEVLDYLQLRVELEGFIVRLAVPCITEAQFQRLEGIITQMGQRQKDGDLMGYSALNQQFHAIIYDACPNKTATDILIKLKQQMRKYNMKTILVPGRNTHSLQEHKAILEAIRLRDAARAEAAVRTHVDSVRRTFQENLALLF